MLDINKFRDSIHNLKQAFINNGYSNSKFDKILSKYIDNLSNRQDETPQPPPVTPETPHHLPSTGQTHEVFYKNQF